jgi:hypothetical protein
VNCSQALLPHTLVGDLGSDIEATTSTQQRFTVAQVAIRDCYDAFLDGLERFSSYVVTGLIDRADLAPYLSYWIEDIHAATNDPEDAAWCATLLTYIAFYRFTGVQSLFAAFDRAIDPASAAYQGFLKQMSDQALARRLASAVDIEYLPTMAKATRA